MAAHVTNLRKVGGSVMLTVPPAILQSLDLKAGSKVHMAVEGGNMIITRSRRRKYTLDELLSQCKPIKRRSKEDLAWARMPLVGRER
jgi:antitoxin ChpS